MVVWSTRPKWPCLPGQWAWSLHCGNGRRPLGWGVRCRYATSQQHVRTVSAGRSRTTLQDAPKTLQDVLSSTPSRIHACTHARTHARNKPLHVVNDFACKFACKYHAFNKTRFPFQCRTRFIKCLRFHCYLQRFRSKACFANRH